MSIKPVDLLSPTNEDGNGRRGGSHLSLRQSARLANTNNLLNKSANICAGIKGNSFIGTTNAGDVGTNRSHRKQIQGQGHTTTKTNNFLATRRDKNSEVVKSKPTLKVFLFSN